MTPFSCDVLLNYNVFARAGDYEKLYEGRAEPEFLLGTAYAPLREEFLTVEKRKTVDEAENVFVSTGGADSEHLTLELIDTAMTRQSKVFHFVVGMMNPDKEMIREKAGKSHNIVIHENVQKMAELMESCDVAISAAGSTLYELCAIGIPTLTYVIADNQIPAAREFERRGIMKNCGNIFELGKETLAKKLIDEAIKLADNKDARIKVSKLMRSLVDGKGADRILESVLQ